MPGKHIIGIVADLKREAEGDYICKLTTVFGLSRDERTFLLENQAKWDLHDKLMDRHNGDDEIQLATSCWKVMRVLGSEFGFALAGGPMKGCELGGTRVNLIWSMEKHDTKTVCNNVTE